MKPNHYTVSAQTSVHNSDDLQPTSSEPSLVVSEDFFQQMLPSIPSWPEFTESYWDLTGGEQVAGDEGFFAWPYDEPSNLSVPLWEQEINRGPATSAGANGGSEFSASQPQHFQHPEIFGGLPPLAEYYPAASAGAIGGATRVIAPQQRARARRGQATDPHSIAERLRRERISEGMKALHDLVPNANKKDKASMLDEIIDHLKFMQQELKMECTRRVESADVASPLDADFPSEGRGSPPPTSETLAETEEMFLKLMDEDMESANQYLQGMGLCLIPISAASTIYTATSPPDARKYSPDKDALPSSPSMSVLMVQQAAVDTSGDTNVSQFSDKDATK